MHSQSDVEERDLDPPMTPLSTPLATQHFSRFRIPGSRPDDGLQSPKHVVLQLRFLVKSGNKHEFSLKSKGSNGLFKYVCMYVYICVCVCVLIYFIYLSMLHYLCNTTCYNYLHYTSCTLYTYVLSPLYHPAVIVRNLLIQSTHCTLSYTWLLVPVYYLQVHLFVYSTFK